MHLQPSIFFWGSSNTWKRPHLLNLELTLAQPLAIRRGQFAAVLKVMRIIFIIVVAVAVAVAVAFAALAVVVAKTRRRGARGCRCHAAVGGDER